jgi:four helix bundle protein
MQNDLAERLFDFNVRTIKFLRKLEDEVTYGVIKYQLTKSSSSSGANYEESQAGSSRADFKNKVNISLKEMRESNYWLRLINAVQENFTIEMKEEILYLVKESGELKSILGAIMVKLRKDDKKK